MTSTAATPSSDDVLAVLRATMQAEFGLPARQIVPTASLIDDLDLDSIDAVDLAVNVERDFGLSLSEGDLKSLHTVQDVVDLLHERL